MSLLFNTLGSQQRAQCAEMEAWQHKYPPCERAVLNSMLGLVEAVSVLVATRGVIGDDAVLRCRLLLVAVKLDRA